MHKTKSCKGFWVFLALTWWAFWVDESSESAISAVRSSPAWQTLWNGERSRAEHVTCAVVTCKTRFEVGGLASFSSEVGLAETHEVVDEILTDPSEHAGVGLAVVDVDVAGGTGEARRTATTSVETC